MTAQARQLHPLTHEPIVRWIVTTTRGPLIVWGPEAGGAAYARRKVEDHGREVVQVRPAASAEMPTEREESR